ncbi:flagellar basal body rod protein FlgC [Actinoplanes regularis]|uniref:Flagellar basal-body rod protein FlgC n=1 Tax=Actinoplanes regularis TaxID=52697 RepID=A0A239GCM1_9ACTN|nr:flagellar basal body rod C-terminal domain-containing protein [Actinoplanes regularis]GIE90333.1 flagellar basal-body rod protein FlgC [Actinoplanes regularis]GLW33957.1 flagellar basal-body rod protein FlgC [Actinoplanes regularis]SNS67076.1 flagellar basal-body rod protein FlgC [Actinoplanes regularis]
MSIFNAIGIASTGVTVHRKWLDAVSDNLSNMNNVSRTSENAFQARYVQAREAQDGNGTEVAAVRFGNPEGVVVYEPDNPLADEQGYVRKPDIDMGSQMAQMMMAQRSYQANLSVVDRARDAYTAAINLGK